MHNNSKYLKNSSVSRAYSCCKPFTGELCSGYHTQHNNQQQQDRQSPHSLSSFTGERGNRISVRLRTNAWGESRDFGVPHRGRTESRVGRLSRPNPSANLVSVTRGNDVRAPVYGISIRKSHGESSSPAGFFVSFPSPMDCHKFLRLQVASTVQSCATLDGGT